MLAATWTAEARPRRCPRDADCDGLTNGQERALGTSRSNADSDRDGLTDGFEVNKLASDPSDPDTDNDNVDDGDEVGDHTDPMNGDTDGDGEGDSDDDDAKGELEPKLVGAVDSVDVAAKTVTIFGCLVVDASSAQIKDEVTLSDLVAGALVKIELDGRKLPALVAKGIALEDHRGEDKGDKDDKDDGDF
jgi:hypothetical protein